MAPGLPSPPSRPAKSCWAAADDLASAISSSSIRALTDGRVSTVLEASSRAQTQTSASSSGRLQSSAKEVMLAVTRRSSSDGAQGSANGYWPRVRCARCPTTEPTCSPKNIGPIAVAHWPMSPARPRVGSSSNRSGVCAGSVGGAAVGVGLGAAIAVSIGRHDSSARAVQSPLPTGTQVRRRPSGETGMPVVSITLSSATRESCSTRIRWMGSTLGSAVPPVATLSANDRVISHWSGAVDPSMFIRSPSRDWKGFPASSCSGGAIPSCYGEEPSPGASVSLSPSTTEVVSVLPARWKVTSSAVPGGSG